MGGFLPLILNVKDMRSREFQSRERRGLAVWLGVLITSSCATSSSRQAGRLTYAN